MSPLAKRNLSTFAMVDSPAFFGNSGIFSGDFLVFSRILQTGPFYWVIQMQCNTQHVLGKLNEKINLKNYSIAHARPKTTRSSKELAPKRFAPCTECTAASPQAYNPGTNYNFILSRNHLKSK